MSGNPYAMATEHHKWRAFAYRLQQLGYLFDPAEFRLPTTFDGLPIPGERDNQQQNRIYAHAADQAGMRFGQHRAALHYLWTKAVGTDFKDARTLYLAIEHKLPTAGETRTPFLLPAIRTQMALGLNAEQRDFLEVGKTYRPECMNHAVVGGISVMNAIEHLASGSYNSLSRAQLCALRRQLSPTIFPPDKPLERYLNALRPGEAWQPSAGFSVCEQNHAADGRELESEAVRKVLKMLKRKEIVALLEDYTERDIRMLPDIRAKVEQARLRDLSVGQEPLTGDRLRRLFGQPLKPETPHSVPNALGDGHPHVRHLTSAIPVPVPSAPAPVPSAHGEPMTEQPLPAQISQSGDGPGNRRQPAHACRIEEQNRQRRKDGRNHRQTNRHAQEGELGDAVDPDALATRARSRPTPGLAR